MSELSIGDTVEIVTTDAHKTRFTIEAIEDDALIGDDVRVPIENIRIVSIQRMDTQKTAAAGITTVAIVIGALMIAGTIVLFP